MAVKTDTELLAIATTISGETAVGGNTKTRVGGLFADIVNSKISLKSWDFGANADAFPTSDAPTIYIVINGDHGVLGDPDYVSDKSWMICLAAGASAFADYIIKP